MSSPTMRPAMANHGTIHGAQWRSSPSGLTLYFDGTDDYVDCGDDESLRIEAAGTIALWFNPTTCQGGLVNWSTGPHWPDERLVLAFNTWAGRELLGFYIADGTNHQLAYEGPFPPVHAWTHFAVTFDGTTVKVYRDGALVYAGGQAYEPSLGNVPLWLGRSQGLGYEYFSGFMGEVRVYNRAISDTEVSNLYAAGTARFKTATALNNLCWEILNEMPDGAPDPTYSFHNPRRGWVYFITETEGDITLSVPGATPPVIHDPANGTEQEAMRFLPKGEHTVVVGGGGTLVKLIARSIASVFHCEYGSHSHVWQYGLYDWASWTGMCFTT